MQPSQDTFRRKRQFAEPDAGRIKDRVGNGRSTRDRSGLAYADPVTLEAAMKNRTAM